MKISNHLMHVTKMKRFYGIILLFLCLISMTACNSEIKTPVVVKDPPKEQEKTDLTENPNTSPTPVDTEETISSEVFSFLNDSGTTLQTRINPPEGFSRLASNADEFSGFLREYSMKPSGSDVLLYNGSSKPNQAAHVAIFDLDVGDRDLQQCADSVMRMYAEYFWKVGAYDKIAFHLTNGFLMEYTKWREGNRLKVSGNDVSWSKTKSYDDSYEEFRNYLTMVFSYAGTLSLSKESSAIEPEMLLPGDMFLEGGSPGHCVMVVDVAVDANGNKAFLLAQGFMPAQEFHIIKNPLHEEDPWYYSSELTYPLRTPLYTFDENSLVRWGGFQLNTAETSLTYSKTSNGDYDNASAEPSSQSSGRSETGVENTVNLLAVGDNLIHIQVVESGLQADGTYNYDHLYANVKEEISAADIAVINQETILGGDQFPYSGYPNFNSPTEIGTAVINAGFDVVLHATNHTMDKGLEGVKNTFHFWEKHSEITVLGINKTKEASEEIPIIEKNGIKLAMLNYTYSLNGYSLPENMPYLVNMLDKKKMEQDIKKAEELADFTIVFPHWGTEYQYEPSKNQEDLTDFYYDLGVDLVIGTHPHVIEPVEWIEKDADHRMLIYYSLGNFMSYQREAPRMLGGMANVTIKKDSKGTYISEASITPLVTHYENGPADYHYGIYKLSEYNETLASNHGVSDLAQDGPITYQETFGLAEQVLGEWFK